MPETPSLLVVPHRVPATPDEHATNLRAIERAVNQPARCQFIFTTTAQTVGNASLTAIANWTSVSDAMMFYPGSGSTFTVPAGCGGLYGLFYQGSYGATIGTRAFLEVGQTTGVGIDWRQSHTTESSGLVTYYGPLDAGVTLIPRAFQQSGGSRGDFAGVLQGFRIGD